MDLQQRKLTKDEWNSIEVPVEEEELRIIRLIQDGYSNVNIKTNKTLSLMGYLKITYSNIIDQYVFCKYLQPDIMAMSTKYTLSVSPIKVKKDKIKKADLIRFSNTDKHLKNDKAELFEFVLLHILDKVYEYKTKGHSSWQRYFYTIKKLLGYSVENQNKTFHKLLSSMISVIEQDVEVVKLVEMGKEIIERNKYLLKYADDELYEHQKKLFTYCKGKNPKLIQYIAPTGTGKTLSPLGLSQEHRVIFVCAARHVGLALAKSAISSRKKVAFAFGCSDAQDIRLHYFSAKDYTLNRRSGGIGKVDNSVGDNVEIMICDIKSYILAMYYMMAFNDKENLILYWDEPTITMDYSEHDFHDIIRKNWLENLIPNVVLSSATLPHRADMLPTISDFQSKFESADVYTIVSYDCKKTIPLIDKEGYVSMPHFMSREYETIVEITNHCLKHKTLLRYIDLGEAIRFIKFVNKKDCLCSSRYSIDLSFNDVDQVSMYNIKLYYLDALKNIKPECWCNVYDTLIHERVKTPLSNIHVTTSDAQTLTDGPTIFLAENVDKVAKFCIQDANIHDAEMKEIMSAITYNASINAKISVLQKLYEDGTREDEGKQKKMADNRVNADMKRLMKQISELQICVKGVSLNSAYVPNSKKHQERFIDEKKTMEGIPFACNIQETIVEQIMLIDDVDDNWKLLLLMGIGVFTSHSSIRYSEIMKELARQQKLYLIIASSDYIYGTNYQFCQGYISKDMRFMSQEKCLQAMGRVGRNNIQHNYSIRFRDNELIKKLFCKEVNKPEVANMARLFNSS